MYKSLYREYRPKRFEDAIGHKYIKEILKNQLKENMAGHAYLFTGIRGTGKTTFAKILAKAFNCEHLEDGEPCLKCENCLGIENGSILDIIEMDAASNTGVENIRNIIEEANYMPTKAKYRVYIIDEVHMLSMGAFNALLKTLEEPPPHVKFILATTDPHKIPATIHSRCQKFEFKKVNENEIFDYLQKIVKETKIEITEEAIKLIANLGDGSVRDAISILESTRALNKKITEKDVREIIGLPDLTLVLELAENMVNNNPENVSSITLNILDQGTEPQNLLQEILEIMQVSLIKEKERIERFSEKEKEYLKRIAKTNPDRLYVIIKKLSELFNDLKWTGRKKAVLLAGLIEIAYNNNMCKEDNVVDDVLNVLDSNINKIVDKKVEIKSNNEISVNTLNEKKTDIEVNNKKNNVEPKESLAQMMDSSKMKIKTLPLQQLLKQKGEIQIFVLISKSEIYIEGDNVYIERKEDVSVDQLLKELLASDRTKEILEENLEQILNKKINIKYKGW